MKPISHLDLYRHRKLADRGLAEPYALALMNDAGKLEVRIVDRYERTFSHEWEGDFIEELWRNRKAWEERMLALAADRADGVER